MTLYSLEVIPMARLTEYTDEQRANGLAVLASTGGNMLKAARLLGVSRSTLRGWAGKSGSTTGFPREPQVVEVRAKTIQLADRLEQVAHLAVGLSIGEKIEDASAKDRLVVAGIAIEKMQLLRGGPTQRQESVSVTLVAGGSLRELAASVLGELASGDSLKR